MNNKIKTYIGFAIKKGSVAYGVDGIKACRKRIFVVLYTQNLSEGSKKSLLSFTEKRGLQAMQIDEYDLLKRRNCKAVAICDKSLADAVVLNLK